LKKKNNLILFLILSNKLVTLIEFVGVESLWILVVLVLGSGVKHYELKDNFKTFWDFSVDISQGYQNIDFLVLCDKETCVP